MENIKASLILSLIEEGHIEFEIIDLEALCVMLTLEYQLDKESYYEDISDRRNVC